MNGDNGSNGYKWNCLGRRSQMREVCKAQLQSIANVNLKKRKRSLYHVMKSKEKSVFDGDNSHHCQISRNLNR